ncbi:MAG: toxin-antitoxin system HicB family antitoxin [Chloroflexota bacterium]|nr:toxin-antitoxin system HicB family antitoxin [Chloroflexota bacterium]MDE2696219.1 toxin-antitoxin system HicB family antitoxin [Chloroflexota bacterium]MXZ45455.1 type II toxin-antitoxin system HicB family antitoxin [Chloroflexota bacterium]
MTALSVEDYLRRPYHIEIVASEDEDGDSGWVAEVRELQGCLAQGRTHDELFQNIERAMSAWIDDALEAGDPVPEPHEEPSRSGRVLVRMPPWLHRDLVVAAEREGVSLNQLVVSLLAHGTGAVLSGGAAPARVALTAEPR